MLNRSAKLAGGIAQSSLVNDDVSADTLGLVIFAIFFGLFTSLLPEFPFEGFSDVDCSGENVGSDAPTTTKCVSLPTQGQRIGERGGSLARRRYQTGRVFLRGIKNPKWIARWREDVIENGLTRRTYRSEVLGLKSDFPTKRLALRELEKRLTVVNDPRYRARPTSTFAECVCRWEPTVLSQHKPSTQITLRSHLRKHLIPFFGRMQLRDIGPEEVQRFISSVKASPKN
jgi:hypothetical protein